MKNKIITALTLALVSSVSASCASGFTGFYVGGQIGMNSTTGTLKIENYNTTPNNATGSTGTFKSSVGSKAFLGGLFAGYGVGIGSCAYVGGELYVNFTNDNNKLLDTSDSGAESQTYKITAKNNYNWGGKIRLGYIITPQSLIFLGLGVEAASWQLKSENISDDTAYPQTGVERVKKKNKSTAAFAPSVGMEFGLTKNLFVRGEYTYVVGAKQKLDAVQSTATAPVGVKTTPVRVNLDTQRFTLGMIYKF